MSHARTCRAASSSPRPRWPPRARSCCARSLCSRERVGASRRRRRRRDDARKGSRRRRDGVSVVRGDSVRRPRLRRPALPSSRAARAVDRRARRAATRPTVDPAGPRRPRATEPAPAEDCLVLNVWTPAADGRRRPVMFYSHGGGYVTGSGGSRGQDGANLARHFDVVVVETNHRLGLLGFLYLDEIGGRGVRGLGEQRRPRHRRRAALGAREHRGVRRRSGERDDLRRVGRRRKDVVPLRDAERRAVLQQGVDRERAGRPHDDARRRRRDDGARCSSERTSIAASGAGSSSSARPTAGATDTVAARSARPDTAAAGPTGAARRRQAASGPSSTA